MIAQSQAITEIKTLALILAGTNFTTWKIRIVASFRHRSQLNSMSVISGVNGRIEVVATVYSLCATYYAATELEVLAWSKAPPVCLGVDCTAN